VAPAELLLWTSTTVVRAPLVEKQHRQLGLLFVVLGEREVQGGRGRRSQAKDGMTRDPLSSLLVNERYDPNSGYGNALAAERDLGNAVLLTHQGYGHLFFQNPSECVNKAMADYLAELITPPRGTVCQSEQQPFDPDLR
jgi:TAP-like protein